MDQPLFNTIPQPNEEPDGPYEPLEDEKGTLESQRVLSEMQANLDRKDIENKILREDLVSRQITNARTQNENDQRDSVQIRVWELIRIWLACVFLILVFSGLDKGVPLCQAAGNDLNCMYFKLHYESPVLVALISSPTVAIIGLAAIMLRYIFPNGESK